MDYFTSKPTLDYFEFIERETDTADLNRRVEAREKGLSDGESKSAESSEAGDLSDAPLRGASNKEDKSDDASA